MKKILLLLLLVSLTGCQKPPVEEIIETEPTYKYEYDLTLENYTKYITFRYHHLDMVESNKQIEVFFETKYPDGIIVDLNSTVLLQSYFTILGNTTYYDDLYPVTFTNLEQGSEVLSYSGIKTFFLIAVTEISGTVKTNDETVALAEQANMDAKNALDTMLEKFDIPYNTLYTESYIKVNDGTSTVTTGLRTTYQKTPFYYESLDLTQSGTIMSENSEGTYDYYIFSNFRLTNYIQKVMILDPKDVVEDDNLLFELNDNWTYEEVSGDFVVSGSSLDLFSLLFNDETIVTEWLAVIGNREVSITFSDLDTRLMVSIDFWVGLSQISIETYYTINAFNPIDLSSYYYLPVTDISLTDPIDLTQIQKGFLEPEANYFYQIDVTEGTYTLNLSTDIVFTLYTNLGEIVEPSIPDSYIYSLHDGTYYIKLYTESNTITSYQIQFTK